MELKAVLESILFASQKPLRARELREVLQTAAKNSGNAEVQSFKTVKEEEIDEQLQQLEQEHAGAERSYRLACIAGAWQFVSLPEFAPWLKAFLGEKQRPTRLSQPALETLAIIAYRQPVTRSEIEQIRGVSVDGVLQTLLERELVEQVGRAEVVGRPATFGTTGTFLEYFGLRNLDDLPAADELRRIPVDRGQPLQTVEEGLATAPPEGLQSQQEETQAREAAEKTDETKEQEETTDASNEHR